MGGADKFELNWDVFYDGYRSKRKAVCPDGAVLANIAVKICYEKYLNTTATQLKRQTKIESSAFGGTGRLYNFAAYSSR